MSYLILLILSIKKSSIINKKIKIKSKIVLSVKLPDIISWVKNKIKAQNSGIINGVIILYGL